MKSTSTPAVRITCTLAVRGWDLAMAFYKNAFGAAEIFSVPGGGVGELDVQGARFWVAEESVEHRNFSPTSLGGCSVRMLIIIANPSELFERAISAGAKSIAPVEHAFGWTLGRIEDPFGHHWEIGCPDE